MAKRLLIGLLLTLALPIIGTIPSATHADEPIDKHSRQRMEQLFYQALGTQNSELFLLSLNAADRSLLQEAGRTVKVQESMTTESAPAANVGDSVLSSCWTQEKRRVGENFLGYDLWRFYLRINWCEDGYVIQSPTSWSNRVDVNYPYWSYSGLVGQSTQGGAGYSTYDVYTQGEFKYCPGTCLEYAYPWIDLVGYTDGWSSWTGGGGTGW